MNLLIVDDDKKTLNTLEEALSDYPLRFARTSKQASTILQKGIIDVALLSVSMKDYLDLFTNTIINGSYPFVMVRETDAKATVEAFRNGASDVITKPIDFDYLKQRIEGIASNTESHVLRNYERMMMYEMPYVMGHQNEARNHVRWLWHDVGKELYDEFFDSYDEDFERLSLLEACSLHDIGKLSIPQHIRDKKGKLTQTEKDKVRAHPVIGSKMLQGIRGYERAAQIIREHHEYYDGSGYPEGKKGKDIDPGARILCPVETLLGYMHYKPYRGKGMPFEEACNMFFLEHRKYDPRVVEVYHHYIENNFLNRSVLAIA
ncbi:MAG: HD domain-containing phosphohydrolase [Candidatus Woesearchaeota archaeon]